MAEQVAANADVVLEGSTPPAVPPTPVVDENGNVVATPPVETPVVETVTSTDLDAIISDDGSGAKPKDAKSRIQQLVAKSKKDAEDAAYWRGVAEGRVATAPPTPPVEEPPVVQAGPPTRPDISQFEKLEEYEAAQEKFIIDAAAWQVQENNRKEADRKKAVEVTEKWVGKVAEASKKIADFDRVVGNPALTFPPIAQILIKESDVGPEMAYYLGTHLDEYRRIIALPNHIMAKEIGKLEVKMAAATAETPPENRNVVSQAPAPISTVTPTGAVTVDEQELPMEEFVARRNKMEMARRRGVAA